jgi:two-component system, OmpR family, KDP operon response regulator KdpE
MNEPGPLILVVDDEPQVRRYLGAALTGHGFRLVEATTGGEALTQCATRNPDLMLLDLGLPDMDGIEVAQRVRGWTEMPIIVLSARGQEQDKVRALDIGADDYLTKPFGAEELLARIRVALRHAARVTAGSGEATFTVGDLRIDFAVRRVFVGDREVHLTPTEYKLLSVLVQHAGKVLTHQQLLKEVWGPAYATHTQYVRVYVGQLRQKLEADTTRPRYVLTEPGVGYRLRMD